MIKSKKKVCFNIYINSGGFDLWGGLYVSTEISDVCPCYSR